MDRKEFWAILSTGIAIIVLLLMIQSGVSGNTRAIVDNTRAIADLRVDIADLRTEIIRETSHNREAIRPLGFPPRRPGGRKGRREPVNRNQLPEQ